MYAIKPTSFLAVLLFPLLLLSCQDNGGKHGVKAETPVTIDSTIVEKPVSIQLIEKQFDDGHYTLQVPEDFDQYITRQVLGKDSMVTVNTFKYRSTVDSSSAVGISHGVQDKAINKHLHKFMQKLEEEARTFSGLRSISSETRMVNGYEFGILRYTLWRGEQETDYSVVAASVIEGNMLTINILFSGPVIPGLKETSNKIIESLQVHTN